MKGRCRFVSTKIQKLQNSRRDENLEIWIAVGAFENLEIQELECSKIWKRENQIKFKRSDDLAVRKFGNFVNSGTWKFRNSRIWILNVPRSRNLKIKNSHDLGI